MRSRLGPSLALALAIACAGAARAPESAPRAETARISGTAHVDDAPGTLVVRWYRPDEIRNWQSSLLEITVIGMERASLVRVADPGDVPFSIDVPSEGSVRVVAILVPPSGGLWSFIDAPPAISDPVDAGASGVELPVQMAPAAEDRASSCGGEIVEIDAPRGSLGGSTSNRLCVHLPPGYASGERRRPVVYALPGLGGDYASVQRWGLVEMLRRDPERAPIVVGIDTRTPLGNSYLVDSPLTGAWERFAAEAVAAIDARYRTIAAPEARAVVGHSTGGFDAISIAFRHPEIFGVVAASSPDALDLEAWLMGDDGRARPIWLGWMRVEDALGGPGQLTSYAVEWSPDERAARGFRWPVELESGAPIEESWARWRAQSPIRWLDDPVGLDRAHRLSGRIFLTVGRADEALLFEPARRFHRALERAGVAHTWVPTELGHLGATEERFAPLARFVIETLRFESAPA